MMNTTILNVTMMGELVVDPMSRWPFAHNVNARIQTSLQRLDQQQHLVFVVCPYGPLISTVTMLTTMLVVTMMVELVVDPMLKPTGARNANARTHTSLQRLHLQHLLPVVRPNGPLISGAMMKITTLDATMMVEPVVDPTSLLPIARNANARIQTTLGLKKLLGHFSIWVFCLKHRKVVNVVKWTKQYTYLSTFR